MTIHEKPTLQRVRGRGRLSAKRSAGRSRIDRLFEEGAAKIRLPATSGDTLEAVIINTAGGLTGGDQLDWQFAAGQGSGLSLTTQASEKVYKAGSGTARVAVHLDAEAGARIAWLPQETILFDASALARTIEANMAPDSHLLLVEPLVLGRKAMGETVRKASFHDRWRVSVDGVPIHAEDFRFAGDASAIFAANATGRGMTAFASLLLVGAEAERMLPRVRELLAAGQCEGGAGFTQLPGSGKLLARIAAQDGYVLRKTLGPLVALLNGAAGLPKIWAS